MEELNGWSYPGSDLIDWGIKKYTQYTTGPDSEIATIKKYSANFENAYKLLRKVEGGYANVQGDKGGETYMGIARKYHPTWSGWLLVDEYKRKNGTLQRGQYIQDKGLFTLVKSFFYRTYWLPNKFEMIKDIDVAKIIFTWVVNSGKYGDRGVQQVLRDVFKKNIRVDNAIGEKTIEAINSIDPEKLYYAIKDARISYYKAIAKNGQNGKFLKGWLRSINNYWYKGIVKNTEAVLTKVGFSQQTAEKISIPIIIGTGITIGGLIYLAANIKRIKNERHN